jgi:nucleoside 2-deoxyribosyltransferase
MSYETNLRTVACRLWASASNVVNTDGNAQESINCIRCGDYRIIYNFRNMYGGIQLPLKDENLRALTSYNLRKMQGPKRPIFDRYFLESILSTQLPSPAEATDNLLLWFAEQAAGRAGSKITYNLTDEALPGIVGVVNSDDIKWAVLNLIELGLIRSEIVANPTSRSDVVELTGKGWNRVEELRRAHIASNYAFFARRFKNKDLDAFVQKCLTNAVKQTGYELRMVTQQAGLIDAIMEHEIRRCRFLIADLSDNNEGAYWEAGFAEGLGKPVFSICCEKDPNDPTKDKKTHFDTNHRHTVRWNADPASFEATAATLKAAIRNTLLGDAKQDDDS